MRKIAFSTLIFLLFSIISPIGSFVHFDRKYTYSSEEYTQPLHFEDVYEPTASLANLSLRPIARVASGTETFQAKKDMFVFRIPKTAIIQNESDVQVILYTDKGNLAPISLDLEGDGREEAYYYTEPIFLDSTDILSYSIRTKPGITFSSLSVIGLDTDDSSLHIAMNPEITSADSPIVTRAQW